MTRIKELRESLGIKQEELLYKNVLLWTGAVWGSLGDRVKTGSKSPPRSEVGLCYSCRR